MPDSMVLLFFFANVLKSTAFAVRKIAWLRILTVIAASLTIPYYFYRNAPLWEAIFWQCVFIVINGVNLIILYLESRPVQLTPEQQRLHLLVFRSLKPREMLKLLHLAQWKTAKKGEIIIENNQTIDNLNLLFDGTVHVESDGQVKAQLLDGRFMGEMSYITSKPTSATLRAHEDTRYLSWNKKELDNFLAKNKGIKDVMWAILGADMAEKLTVHTKAV